MIDTRILLSASWVALEFLYQQGDMLRLYSRDFVPGEVKLGSFMTEKMMWMISAIIMTIPVVMIILSLVLPYAATRWANIIVAALFFLYTLGGLRTYSSAYDRFLLIVSMVVNAFTIWTAWNWVA